MSDTHPHHASCPVCGAAFHRIRHDWLFRCGGCKVLASTLEPAIPQEQTQTRLDEDARLAGLSEPRRRSNAAILDALVRLLGGTDRSLLDVGCGPGLFLKEARSRGFRAEGVEPDANVVARARAASGAPARHGFFPDALGADERFDGIVFNDVLEHIPQVEEAVMESERHLHPGGILVLNCPDQGGVFYRLADFLDRLGISQPIQRLWQHGLPSPHVWYFGARHLTALGQKAGFEQQDVIRLSPITAKGLRQRVSYVEGQSRLLNGIAYAGAVTLLPVLGILPRDTTIVFLRKPHGGG